MAAPLKLYHYWRSSSSWRVRWVLAYKQIPCEFVSVNLLSDEPESPEHLRRNPMGFVPVLEIADPKIKHPFQYLAESVAIIEWLEEAHPRPALLPGDSYRRARIRQLVEIINAGTQPIQNLNVTQLHSSDPAEQKKWNQYWIRKGLHAFETLAKETSGKFSVGDELSLADVFLVPQCYNANRNEIPLSEFPLLERIHAAAIATPSAQASAPDRFKPES